ncbi:hypothetical protein [Streptosporangium sp. KLBMP 9127]|nr:hypothetical protein [Streptosporangium sp. KLBMP 9127]
MRSRFLCLVAAITVALPGLVAVTAPASGDTDTAAAAACIAGAPPPEPTPNAERQAVSPIKELKGLTVRPSYTVTADAKATKTISYDDVRLDLGVTALDEPTEIGITPLTEEQLPVLGAGMENVTEGPRAGYRFTPTPYEFEQDITVSVPYDAAELEAAGLTPQDVRTYYFDPVSSCWQALEVVSVDTTRQLIISRTNHFTDMVNATVNAPEGPDQVSFDPTRISGIQAADPSNAVNQIAAPTANNQGEARLAYPLELPAGREGIEPALSVASALQHLAQAGR